MRMHRIVLLVMAAAMLVTLPVFAWHDTGHEVVGRIAYRNLTPATKQKVDAILQLYPDFKGATPQERFLAAATWPDYVRNYGIRKYNFWQHYINIPYRGDLPANRIDRTQGQHNVVTILQLCNRDLRNPGVCKQVLGAERLSWIIHLTGDIHCPMHTITRYSLKHPKGDRGGNDFFVLRDKKKINLHFYWDHTPDWDLEEKKITQEAYAAGITKEWPRSKFAAELKEKDYMKIAIATHKLGEDKAYKPLGVKEPAPVSKEYEKNARIVVRKQLALAGYRLADSLNSIFDGKK